GLRVLHQGKTAYAYTNDCSEAALLELADGIAEAVAGEIWDTDIVLKRVEPSWRQVLEIDPTTVPLEEKITLLKNADE
ncbi:hypothetical protein NL533_36020, partial [Klebsiella pneumoniae]|nr:hypothetical protein [Klebsiella pneumoniae]